MADHDVIARPDVRADREVPRSDAAPKEDSSRASPPDQSVSDDRDGGKDGRAPEQTRKKRGPWGFIILGLVVLVAAVGGGWYWFAHRDLQGTDDAYTDGRAITVAPQVKGLVVDLKVNDNQFVHAGDLLLKIDPRDYVAARDQARAQLELARAQRDNARVGLALTRVTAPAKLAQSQAQLASARAAQVRAEADYRRQRSVDPAATTRQNVDQASASSSQAVAQTADADAQVRQSDVVAQMIAQAEAQIRQWDAQVAQAQAQVDQAELNLSYTNVVAPQDGWITRRNVERGTYIEVGTSVFSVVTPERWVTANFKETELRRMRPGQRVDIGVDAYPDLKLTGHVDSVQLGSGSKFSAFPAENATGNYIKIVQRIPVKIVIDSGLDPQLPLPLGLSVSPTVRLK